MRPLGVVEGDPLGDDALGHEAIGQFVQIDSLVFWRPPQPFATPASLRTPVKSTLVNWLPWSVLKISGWPYSASASFNASTQNPASMVFDSRH
jgi:hypothetical protein